MCIPIFLGSSSSRLSTLSPQLQENEYVNFVGNSITPILLNQAYAYVSGASCRAHGKIEMAKLVALARRRHALLHESANEVNRSGGDEQVISCHCYLVFHLYVEQLTVFQTPGLILASSSIFRVLNLDHHAIARWQLCINPYISIVNPLLTDIQTYIHTYIHTSTTSRPHQHLLCLHDYEPHTKAFGNLSRFSLPPFMTCIRAVASYLKVVWPKCIHTTHTMQQARAV